MKRGQQKEIAQKLNVSQAFVSMYFKGIKTPAYPLAKEMAKIFKTTPGRVIESEAEARVELVKNIKFK